MAADPATFNWASVVSSLIIATPSTFAAIAAWRSAKNTRDVLKLQHKKDREAELSDKIDSKVQKATQDLWLRLQQSGSNAP